MLTRALITSTLCAVLAPACLGVSPAAGSGGLLAVHVAISGKGDDSGGFSRSESVQVYRTKNLGTVVTLDGCAVIKKKKSPMLSATGPYEYRVSTTTLPPISGVKPTGAGIALDITHYRPTASRSTYKKLDVSGRFALNGRSYSNEPTNYGRSVVTIWDGGKSGTWVDPHGDRTYPAKMLTVVKGFGFSISWHCTNVFDVSE